MADALRAHQPGARRRRRRRRGHGVSAISGYGAAALDREGVEIGRWQVRPALPVEHRAAAIVAHRPHGRLGAEIDGPHQRMVLQIRPTPGSAVRDARRPRRCSSAGSPMPESISRRGVSIAPSARMISPVARVCVGHAVDEMRDRDAAAALEAEADRQRAGQDGQVRRGPRPGADSRAPRSSACLRRC